MEIIENLKKIYREIILAFNKTDTSLKDENELEKIVEQDRNAIVTDVKVESNRTSFAKDVIVAKYNMEMLHINNFIAGAGNQRAKIESALNNHPEYVKQKIMEFANLGLSIANKD